MSSTTLKIAVLAGDGIGPEVMREAIKVLTNDADKHYDRRVVTALAQYVENHPTKLDGLGIAKQA